MLILSIVLVVVGGVLPWLLIRIFDDMSGALICLLANLFIFTPVFLIGELLLFLLQGTEWRLFALVVGVIWVFTGGRAAFAALGLVPVWFRPGK